MELYEESVTYIQNNQAGAYSDLLRRIPFSQSEDNEIDNYFILSLKMCAFYNAKRCVKVLYDHFVELFNIEVLEVPYFISLLGEVQDADIFVFLHRHAAKHFTYEEIIDVAIEYFTDQRIGLVINNCERIFGRQPLHFYREMYRRSTPNKYMAEVLSEFVKDDEVYAPYPEWTFPQVGLSYLEDATFPPDIEFEVEVDNLENVANMIMKSSELEGDEYSKEKERILQSLYMLTEEEIKEFVRKESKIFLSLNLASNEEFFHAYGPLHPIEEPLHEIEERFGGSRMFLSVEKELEDYDQVVRAYEGRTFTHKTWFTGNCEQCLQKIRRWRHALRMPAVNGGWMGCYCSSDCMVDAIAEMNVGSYYLIQLWAKIYQDIKNYGIEDFLEEPIIEIAAPSPPKNVSYYRPVETVVNDQETIVLSEYEELGDLIHDYPDTLICTLFANDETSQGIIEAYRTEKERLLPELSENPIIFVLFTVTEESNIDNVDPPEFTAYYQLEDILTVVDFDDHQKDISTAILLAYQKAFNN